MKLPNAENAVIDIKKLRDYCLNPNHPEGKHKARVFLEKLDIGRDDAERLHPAGTWNRIAQSGRAYGLDYKE